MAGSLLLLAGCIGLPGVEADRDATLINNSNTIVTVYTLDANGRMARERAASPGESRIVELGGNCETGWRIQRDGEDPV